ncbi:V-type ATP synthase subunit E [Clostridium sp. Marseille-P299]|uniref:V-type ATP synthase subunit E n=1 Tax=Clostridium sp. Marseille-P299 TaxID=1805477 RepID=UPI0008361B10|nr:V-type ATP synthase subunit E [Clostridium sp. Marseille-P299]
MNIKEKAEHFYNTAVDAATALNTSMVEEYTQLMKKNYEEYKKEAEQKAASYLKQESEKLHREKNSALAVQILSIRHKQSDLSHELTEQLFTDVKNRLNSFMKTEEYVLLLEKQIKDAIAFSKGLPMTVYINPSDEDKKKRLEESTGIEITISDRDFWGGIRAVIHEKDILINNSFESKFIDAKEQFSIM